MTSPRERILGSKRDELRLLLRSRKRKLAQLYDVTEASYLNAKINHDEHRSKFLHRNDVEKGRPFDSATLPPLRRSARISNTSNSTTTAPIVSPNSQNSIDTTQTRAELSKSRQRAGSVSTRRTPLPDDTIQLENPPKTQSRHLRSGSQSRNAVEKSPSRREALRTNGPPTRASPSPRRPSAVATADSNNPDSLPAEDWERRRIATKVESPPGSPGVDPARVSKRSASVETGTPGNEKTKGRPQIHIPSKDIPPDKLSAELTPTSLPGSHLQPQHRSIGVPSPASTDGHYSTHTPQAEGPASDTSPEDESRSEVFDPQKTPASGHTDYASAEPESLLQGSLRDLDKLQTSRTDAAKIETASADAQLQLESGQAHGQSTNDVSSDSFSSSARRGNIGRPVDGPTASAADAEPDQNTSSLSNFERTSPSFPKLPSDPQKSLPPLQTRSNVRDPDHSKASASMDNGSTSATATKSTPTTVRSPPERMTTRVSSGAIRHRSVSEILGGPIDKSTLVPSDPTADDREKDEAVISPTTRLPSNERREKDRLTQSTVVFGHKSKDLQPVEKLDERDDYLLTLFVAQAHTPPRSMQLNNLLSTAPKVLSTSDHMVDLHEQQDCRILKKIYQLQYTQRWPLRQIARAKEPPRQAAHWDAVLQQVKWMRSDFRQERKWKIVLARNLAHACALYAVSTPAERRRLVVKVKPRGLAIDTRNPSLDTVDASQPTPDLVHSAGYDSSLDSPSEGATVAPATVFSLPPSEVIFELKLSGFGGKLLSELPLFDLPSDAPKPAPEPKLLPVSKYVNGKVSLDRSTPPKRRSRYDYDTEDSDGPEKPLPLECADVALFNPESRHILDRIHSGHAFRPPSEFTMPTIGFYESRNSSQWTPAEDDELRALVKEYQYNWSLISSILMPATLYTSGAERRTPWECFERWIGLEGLPAEMQKTAYFRTYSNRLATAQKNLARELERQAQQDRANGANQPMRRQRTIQPLKVERRKQTKHLAIIDAMRKLAKKRESSLQKQRDGGTSNPNKPQQAPSIRSIASTPAEFSRIKHEKEVKYQEAYKNELLKAKQAASAMQSRAALQSGNSQTSAPPPPRANGAQTPNGTSSNLPTAQQNRPQLPGQGIPNGLPLTNGNPSSAAAGQFPMQFKGMPQAPMQNGSLNQQRFPTSPESRVMSDAQRVQADQRRLAEQQQRNALQQQMIAASMRAGNSSQPGLATSPNMSTTAAILQQNLAALQQQQNIASQNGFAAANNAAAGLNGFQVNASRMAAAQAHMMGSPSQPQALSSGHVPQINHIHHYIKTRNPDLSPEQVQRLANEHLSRTLQQQAMSSAAGVRNSSSSPPQPHAMLHQHHNSNSSAGSNMLVNNMNEYTRQIRAQQASQSGSGGRPSPMSNGNGRPDSRGGGGSSTPSSLNPQQSPQMGVVTQQAQTQQAG